MVCSYTPTTLILTIVAVDPSVMTNGRTQVYGPVNPYVVIAADESEIADEPIQLKMLVESQAVSKRTVAVERDDPGVSRYHVHSSGLPVLRVMAVPAPVDVKLHVFLSSYVGMVVPYVRSIQLIRPVPLPVDPNVVLAMLPTTRVTREAAAVLVRTLITASASVDAAN